MNENYDNLKECRNCGKYAISLSAIGYCRNCQATEDYVPSWYYVRCPYCHTLNSVDGDETKFYCEVCDLEVSS